MRKSEGEEVVLQDEITEEEVEVFARDHQQKIIIRHQYKFIAQKSMNFCMMLSIFIFQSKARHLHDQSNDNWNRSQAIPGYSGSSANISSGLPKPIPARREEHSPGNFQHEELRNSLALQYHNTPPPPSPPPPANNQTMRAGSVKDSRSFTRGSGLKNRGRSGSRGKGRGRGKPKKPPANYHTIRAGSVKDSGSFTRGSRLKHRGRSGSRGKGRGRGTPKKISALDRLGPKVPENDQSASSTHANENYLGSINHLSKVFNEDSRAGDSADLYFNPDDFVTLDEVGDDEEGDIREDMEESQADDSKDVVDSGTREEGTDNVNGSERPEAGQSSKALLEKEEFVTDQSKRNEDIIVKPEEDDVEFKDGTVKEENEVKVETDHLIKMDPDRPIGQEYIRQVVMYFCDLVSTTINNTITLMLKKIIFQCHKYLPKVNRGDIDELIDSHCMSSVHQNLFVKKEAEKRLEEQEALKLLVKV